MTSRCNCGAEAAWGWRSSPGKPVVAVWSSVYPGVLCWSCVMRTVREMNGGKAVEMRML